ncbi:MAG: hypothetical protein GX660_22440 [Clostridiaceae bacterium]|nr:hypothetical protein [Clostridiaceae bacterium]
MKVISQLVGEHVISIDPSIEELKEAPSNSIKIVMNAENLLSNSVLYDIMKADIIGGETMNGMNVNVRVCLFVEDIEKMVSFYKNIRFMIRQ